MNVVMIGSGYVGLVSGTCFAEFGANVICIDVDKGKIDALNKGVIPIYEPGLNILVEKNINEGRLIFSSEYSVNIANADLIFIAVGSPSRHGDGHADLSYVYQAAHDIAPCLDHYTVIVDKSTVPVGTARNVERIIREDNPDADFNMASNPEFLREGAAINDFMRPDRVVIGVENKRAETLLRELYRPINLIEAPFLVTDLESAELIKDASNAFLATKISFINEISMLCEAVGADVHAVSKGMGLDGRIGKKFLHPGPGFGGSCFPKDTQALVRTAQEHGVSSRIIESVIEVNAAQKARMIKKICSVFGGDVSGKKIAVLGLTFKPDTDDMRDS
ncbi:MAG: UDP-glucose/GDP-mannose dehydrogenase family protein, partial [Gammaproteobacteria bacterium]|nr:UDP-glucose/GDP-mannose dehydrogenase family protein [Gammaproteobacteria bacterium]